MLLNVSSMYPVSTKEIKNARVNLKTKPSLRLKFRAVSIIEEVTMSDLINQFMRKKVIEVENQNPEIFKVALEQAKEDEENERKIRKPKDSIKSDYDEIPQTRLFSDGTGKPLKRKRSRAIEKDIEDATQDAIERTKKKTHHPHTK